MIEPVKVTAPIARPSDISMRLAGWMPPPSAMPKASRRIERAGRDQHRREADQRVEHRHQLRHRRHLDGARAPDADAAADGEAENDEQPARSRSTAGVSASVVSTAIAMPIMPKRLPWREEAGEERPRKARMNRTPATR